MLEREVEAEPFGGDVGAALFDMGAEHLAQCRLQQVGRGVESGGFNRAVGESAFELLFGAGSRKLLMFGEGGVVTGAVDLESLLLRHFDGELDREAVGLVEVEGVLAGDHLFVDVRRHAVDQLLEFVRSLFQRDGELFLLAVELFADDRLLAAQFRIDVAELFDDRFGDFRGEVVGNAELATFADGAADQAAQHIGLVHLARGDAVGEDEGRGAEVVRDDPLRRTAGALQNGGDPFESHAGIDVALGERFILAFGSLVVLHEDVVPDLNPALVGRIELFRRRQFAGPVEHFGIRTAGTGNAGGTPPVVFFAEFGDPFGRDAEGVPEFPGGFVEGGVLVTGEDTHREPFDRDVEVLLAGQEFETEMDRLLLEVVAERPVAEHFEEGEVDGVADLVDVAGADALLKVGEPFPGGMFRPLEIGDEGVHSGGGEEAGRIVFRNHRSALNLLMALRLEELDVFTAFHGEFSSIFLCFAVCEKSF